MQGSYRIFLPLILALLLSGCRYEDGPLVSFRSPWTRLTMHPKKLTRLEMDGVDYLPMFNADFPNSTFRFTKEGYNSQYIIYWDCDVFGESCWAGIDKSFGENSFKYMHLIFEGPDYLKPDVKDYTSQIIFDKYIFLLFNNPYSHYPNTERPIYKILKLTSETLVLKGECIGCTKIRKVVFESI